MRTMILFAAVTAVINSAPAIAGEPDAPVAQIRIADLDLATTRGRAMFERRVGSALEQVCGAYTDPEISAQDRVTACRRAAKASIYQQVAAIRGIRVLAVR